jgi:hypothetical protein
MAYLNRVFDKINKGVLSLLFASGAFVGLYLENWRQDTALRDVQYFNGWVLVSCIGVLMLLSLRKRIIVLPLGRVRLWLLIHYYVGFVTVGIFLVHTKYRLPDSPLEWLLWTLFMLVAGSGVFGAVISKIIPPRLETHGERILLERIPVFRAQLAVEAETLARDSVRTGNTASIAKLYVDILGDFFAGPRNILAHLQSSNLRRVRVLGELALIERYLDEAGKVALAKLRDLVEAKNDLDFHYANGGLLRVWVFLHIPATYALLMTTIAHVVLVYSFSTR